MALSFEKLESILESCKGRKIAVAGDLILDVYLWGSASRISQEAPVPVVRVKKRTHSLGGAANVMRNVVTLGGSVYAAGVTGSDDNGKTVRELLGFYGIDASSVYDDEGRKTTEKQRVIAGSQQLVRIDHEDVFPISDELRKRFVADLKRLIKDKLVDAIIFEDYAKGMLNAEMLQEVTDEACRAGVITALDPHPGHPLEVKNLTLMTPNRSEAFGLAGIYCYDPVSPVSEDKNLREVADILMQKWTPDCLLITLGAQGMALFRKDKEPVVIPTKAREVFDVSGAGDTVISAFTLALAGGADPIEAAEISNHAAGVVVGKIGTVSVTVEELKDSFRMEGNSK